MLQNRYSRAQGSVRGSYLIALGVLGAGLVLTALCYVLTFKYQADTRRARFSLYATEVATSLEGRFAQYLGVLDSSAGLFTGAAPVRRADWQGFADTIALDTKYPGISSLQYLTYVPRAALPGFVAATRA